MIKYYTKEDNQLIELQKPTPNCWINISPPLEQSELSHISETFDIPLDYLIDSLDIDERSRYEIEDDVKLIVINAPFLSAEERENLTIFITVPIGIILVREYIITITARENAVIEKFLENKVKNFNPSDSKLFVLQLMEQNVLYYLRCLQQLNLKRNLIEEELYNSSRNEELQQLLRIEKSLVYFVNSLSANELLKLKMKRVDFLKIRDLEEHFDLFEDTIIDNSQALEMANVHTNILSGTMEAYASIVSNNLNIFIQRLTIVTIILMVPTLVASFYGMNVTLPFSKSPIAFYIIIVISIFLGIILIWFFRRKRLF